MKEIKLVFGKGGKVQILTDAIKGKGTEGFTEKLAKDLGETEERHRAHSYQTTEQQNKTEINNG